LERIHLIDVIGPFFRGYDRRTINWSKIPWAHVAEQTESGDGEAFWAKVRADLEIVAKEAAAWGYDSASLDDVSHLTDHEWLEPDVRARVARYREEFRLCFQVLRQAGLQIFVTMDVFSATAAMRAQMAATGRTVNEMLRSLLAEFLTTFPEVSGVILRIGESDGKDVRDDFHSDLVIQKPVQARELLDALLPIFDERKKRLIFRTWTVGAYKIGDLMWHRDTFAAVFDGIQSPSLVISMKYGESDFFRYLPLNKNFFRNPIPKIIELQARREYEGCGEYPSFVGWEYERYLRELSQGANVIGCMVWCQTGGWVPFRRLAFLQPEAVWTDLNTYVTIQIVKHGAVVADAVRDFAKLRGLGDADALIELLRLSDEVIRELLYVEEFAQQKLFFRRVRIPPLLQVYWCNIFVSHSIKKVVHYFVKDPEAALRSAARCLDNLERMEPLAAKAGVPVEDITYMHDTFRLLALAREYCLLPFTPEMEAKIRAAKKAYKAKYPKRGLRARYRVKTDFTPLLLKRRHLGWALQLFMRKHRGYRWVDRIVTLHLLSLIYRVISKRRPQWIPKFARESAMGVDVVFK